MKRLFGYQSYWYAGATLTLGLLGWVGVEQATAQVRPGPMPGAGSRDPGVIVHTVPSTQAQEHVDYVNAKPMPLPKAPRGSAAQAQDDLINSLTSQSLSGNKAFIREDLRSYSWQGQERTYWIIGLLPYF